MRALLSIYFWAFCVRFSQKQNAASLAKIESNMKPSCESCNLTESPQWFLANVTQEAKQQPQSHSQVLTYQLSLQSQILLQQQQLMQQSLQQNQQPQQMSRLCANCWSYWRKYGALKFSAISYAKGSDSERPGPDRRQGIFLKVSPDM